MYSTIFPSELEIMYRNNKYRHVQDALNDIIVCAICNSNIKQKIILNGKIMLHQTFLCLCCEVCFEKLSVSKGCIFCSTNTEIKACKICSNKMCKRCIDSFYFESAHSKELKECFRCSSSVLWSLRAQTAAVLKCFSLELNSRLLISGKEFENKQYLYKYVINAAKTNNSVSKEDIQQIRVKYLFDSFNSKINPLLDAYKCLESQNTEDCITNFSDFCENISILQNMSNKKAENKYGESQNKYSSNNNLFELNENIILNNCDVSLIPLDEEIVKTYILKKENNYIDMNVNCSMVKHKEKLSSEIDGQMNRLNKQNTAKLISNSEVMSLKPVVVLEDIIEKDNNKYIKQKYKKKLNSEAFDSKNKYTVMDTKKTVDKFVKEYKNEYLKEMRNNFLLKECSVVLEIIDLDTIKHTNYSRKNKDGTKKSIQSKTLQMNNKRKLRSETTNSKQKKT